MNTIIKLLRDECLPCLNQYYQILLEQSEQQPCLINKDSFSQNLRDLWGFSHVLQEAGSIQDIIAWLAMLNDPGDSDVEKAMKEQCRERAQQCFEQILINNWPDEKIYRQAKQLLY